jgi:hypothetical protein
MLKRRVLMVVGLAALAVTLALVAGALLPPRARPVVLGVVAGMGAGLTTSLVLVWRVGKLPVRVGPVAAAHMTERPPTVILVPPPETTPSRTPPPAPPPAAGGLVHETRPVTIVGGTDDTSA